VQPDLSLTLTPQCRGFLEGNCPGGTVSVPATVVAVVQGVDGAGSSRKTLPHSRPSYTCNSLAAATDSAHFHACASLAITLLTRQSCSMTRLQNSYLLSTFASSQTGTFLLLNRTSSPSRRQLFRPYRTHSIDAGTAARYIVVCPVCVCVWADRAR